MFTLCCLVAGLTQTMLADMQDAMFGENDPKGIHITPDVRMVALILMRMVDVLPAAKGGTGGSTGSAGATDAENDKAFMMKMKECLHGVSNRLALKQALQAHAPELMAEEMVDRLDGLECIVCPTTARSALAS
jgi:hypothetical protein